MCGVCEMVSIFEKCVSCCRSDFMGVCWFYFCFYLGDGDFLCVDWSVCEMICFVVRLLVKVFVNLVVVFIWVF